MIKIASDTTLANFRAPTGTVLPEIKEFPNLVSITMILIFLMVLILILLFDKDLLLSLLSSRSSQTKEEITNSLIFILSAVGMMLLLAHLFLPSLTHVNQFFSQIKNVFIVFIYTVLFVVLFRMIPSSILDTYSYIITPAVLALTAMIFYAGSAKNYILDFNVDYERIKSIILFMCLTVVLLTVYSVDPGGYAQKYFGFSMSIASLLLLFSFLYIVILFTVPNDVGIDDPYADLFENMSKLSMFGNSLFVMFLIACIVGISIYPGGFFNDIATSTAITVLLMMVILLWVISLGSNLFYKFKNNSDSNDKISGFKKGLTTMISMTGIISLIIAVVSNYSTFSSQSTSTTFALSILLVLMVIAFIYKTYYVKLPSNTANYKKNTFFELIISILIYVPCLARDAYNGVTTKGVSEYNKTTSSSLITIGAIAVIAGLYVAYPILYNKINLQGGKQLLNKPIPLDKKETVAEYHKLNASDDFNYQYGLSSWVFLHAVPPNTSSTNNKYISLLNYGGRPNILYKPNTNTLIVTIEENKYRQTQEVNSETEIIDEQIHKIIYKNDKVLLQKWNNIIINYYGGTLDIFLNGELVKSAIEIVPYMTDDTLAVGSDDGVSGGICNIVYFNKPLTTNQMYYLYTMVKDKTPPITNNDKTIIPMD